VETVISDLGGPRIIPASKNCYRLCDPELSFILPWINLLEGEGCFTEVVKHNSNLNEFERI
jgi:hypothetical protein